MTKVWPKGCVMPLKWGVPPTPVPCHLPIGWNAELVVSLSDFLGEGTGGGGAQKMALVLKILKFYRAELSDQLRFWVSCTAAV